jgi:hypothetical protein
MWVLLPAFLSASLWAASLQPAATVAPLVGPPPTGGGDSWSPILTPDGRYVLFASTANNLALGGNGVYQPLLPPKINVFLRDRTNGTTILVSVNLSGTGGGNGDSIPTALSTNGQYALFESTASNLVANDTNNAEDVFLRDVVNNQTFLVSVNTNGQCANGASQSSTMTPDGRYVAFSSVASNLVAGDSNGIADIFVRDMLAGTTMLASPGAVASTNSTARSDAPGITPDGRYVAFLSTAANLVSGATAVGDVYVYDLIGLGMVRASASARSLSGSSFFFNHAISDDGQYIAFESGSTNVGTVYRYNLSTTELDVVSSNGVTASYENVEFHNLDMTPDGRFVTYLAAGTGTNSSSSSAYVWDGQSNTTTLISGQPGVTVETGSVCAFPAISSNGQYVAFLSSSLELTPVTSNTTTAYHLYLWNAATGSNGLIDLEPGGQVSYDTFMSGPCVTPDGRYIAFDATDSKLGGDPLATYYNVYLSDQTSNGIETVSLRQSSLPSATARALSIGSGYSVSSNGQYVAYSCVANRVAAGATNDYGCIFVGDLEHGANIVVSVDTNNVADPNGTSTSPVISANGRYVAFASAATNLVTNVLPGAQNVFLRDLQMGATTLVSVNTNGAGGNNVSFSPLLDASGRYVLFQSQASDLAGVPVAGVINLFFRDTQANAIYRLTAGNSTAIPAVTAAAMTPDGHYVAFVGLTQTNSGPYQVCLWDSQAVALVYSNTISANTGGVGTNIAVSPDGNRLAYIVSSQYYGLYGEQLYAVDRAAQSNWMIATGVPAYRSGPQFTGDSRYLVYAAAPAFKANSSIQTNDVYRYDFQTQSNLLISQSSPGGSVGNNSSDSPAISWNGRFVAYRSTATNLAPGGTNGFPQIYLYDSQSNTTSLLSVGALTSAGGDNRSRAPVFSGDSATLFFSSWASDLLTNDFSGSGGIFALGVAPPELVCVIRFPAGGVPVISWPAFSGITYQAQFKNNLTDPSWQPLPGSVTIVSNTGSATDSSPSSQQRFYRVQSN